MRIPYLLALCTLATTAAPAQTLVRRIPELPALTIAMDVALDSADNIWVACWQSDQIVKLSPTGQELARIGPRFRSGSTQPYEFSLSFSIATGPSGDVYVADGSNVIRFDASGRFISAFGGPGNGPGRFLGSAGGVAVAPNGDVYVVDPSASRVQRFDRQGNFIATFGASGSGVGQFNFTPADGYAVGIEVDASGSVYVVDPGNNRVQKFAANGSPLLQFGIAALSTTSFVQTGITVDHAGRIYVSRRRPFNSVLQKFDPNGTLLATISGSQNAADGQYYAEIGGVAVDSADNLYIAETFQGRVQKIDAAGAFVGRFGCGPTRDDGAFWQPTSVAWDANGRLLVADLGTTTFTPRIQRLTAAGAFVDKVTLSTGNSPIMATDAAGNFYLSGATSVRKFSSTGTLLATIGSLGSGPGQFLSVAGIAVDAADNLWVSDAGHHRVQKFSGAGGFLLAIGGIGVSDGLFNNPMGIAFAPNGDVLVADALNTRVQRFNASGSFVSKTTFSPAFRPTALAVDTAGTTFVGGQGDYTVQVLGPSGSLLTRFAPNGGGPGEAMQATGLAVYQGLLAVADRSENRVQIFNVANLDSDAPIVTIDAPAAGAVLGSTTVPIVTTIDDANATTVTSNNAGLFLQLPPGHNTVSMPLTFPGADGPRILSVSALDATGRTGGTSVSFTIDTTAPSVTMTSPTANAVLGTAQVTVTATVTDLTATTVVFSHGGGTRTLPANGGVVSTVVTLADGPNTLSIQVTDAAGNQTTVTRTVTADLSVPIVTITAPLDGSTFGAGTSPVAVAADVQDLSATTVNSTPAGVSASLPAGGGTALGAVALVEGTNTITVQASDAFSRTGTAHITVVLDTTAPSVAFDAPASGARVRGTVDVAVSAADALPGSGVASVAFSVDGNPLTSDTEAPFELHLDTTTLSDGSHTVTALATDGKGNSHGEQVTVLVDNTPALLTFVTPADRAVVGGNALGLAVDAADAGSGLKSVTLKVGSLAPSTDGSTTYGTPVATATVSGTEDTTRWPDGELLLTATAVDDAGNETVITRTVVVDNTAPASALVSPVDGARVAGMVPIVAQANDPNLQSLVIKVDGTVVGSTTAAALTVNYDATNHAEGPMLIEVVVTDLANNQGTSRATVQVVNFTCEFSPRTLSLKTKGQGVVTAQVEGPNVASLLPVTAHVIELRVRGGNPVRALRAGGIGDADGDTIQDVSLHFDRQTLIASIRAGIAGGFLPAEGDIDVQLVVDGSAIATARTRVNP